jgi:cytochrome c-type biogenesis protein CcmH/NrfG
VKIPKIIKLLLVSVLLVALLVVGLFQHYGWTAEQRLYHSMPPAHWQALAYVARASAYTSRSDHDANIANLRLAIKLEPNSRDWQSLLAFELWQVNRTSEAVSLWKKLAEGDDDIAIQAAKWLKKTENAGVPKQ